MDVNVDLNAIRTALEEMKTLSTEQVNEKSVAIDRLETSEILSIIHNEDRSVMDVVSRALPDVVPLVDDIAAAIERGGRLVYVGAGTSGRLGVLDAAECPPTFGVSPTLVVGMIAGGIPALTIAQEGAEDERDRAKRDTEAFQIARDDVVVGITARGKTPYVRETLRLAKEIGAGTGLISCNPVEKSSELDHLIVLDVGPEVITGSTRMKAGLATKMALTMISTSVMVKVGRVKGNRMVHLMPNSTKLQARQVSMVMEELSVPFEEAVAKLEAADWNLSKAL